MIRLLAFLFAGCWHRWEVIAHGPLVINNSETGRVRSRGHYYTLQCKRCGAIKRKDLA